MQTEGERLLYLIELKEDSVRQFCLKNDILYTTLHPIVAQNKPLGMNVLRQIMQALPNINVNWVLTGKGEMEIGDIDHISPKLYSEKSDPGYKAFLEYLKRDSTRNELREIIKEIASSKK